MPGASYLYNMKKVFFLIFPLSVFSILASVVGCQQNCVDNLFLQTTKMNLEVNSDNLGILPNQDRNSADTIKSRTRQFYNYPEFLRIGRAPARQGVSWVSSAYAAKDCPEQETYLSRMDPLKTRFSLNVDYDATALGLGVLPAGSDLLQETALRTGYLADLVNNPFINAGAPTPVTLGENFFEPIDHQWVIFYFYFEEVNGAQYSDSVYAFVDLAF